MPGMEFSPVADYCAQLDVPYTRISVPVYDIVFNERKEKNPCSLCAKLRRGSLHTALTERGIRKIALGHHYDDALPVVKNTCPMDGHSRRQEVKELLVELEQRYPDLRKKLFGAMQRYPLYGWDLETMEK